jgi:hypothetical protein
VSVSRRVYIHVGLPKTGTTYLQGVLWDNRATLRAHGVLYPGERPEAHYLAAMELDESVRNWHPDELLGGTWPQLLAQIRDWPGTVILSHEWFAALDQEAVRRVRDDLGDAQVHIVCTVRELTRQVVAVWQEDIKNRQVLRFDEFAAALHNPGAQPHPLVALFWLLQDLPAVLRRWTRGLGSEQVHVITMPAGRTSPGALWSRFARAVGIPDEVRLDGVEEVQNPSMGVVETNLVRRLNVALADRLPWLRYDALVKSYLSLEVLGGRDGRVPLRLPPEHHWWVDKRARSMVEELRAAGYAVVGDLDELIPAAAPEPGSVREPDDASDAELLDAALAALGGLLCVRSRSGSCCPPSPGGEPGRSRCPSSTAAWRSCGRCTSGPGRG